MRTITKRIKAERRAEAEKRNEAYNQLTLAEKLARLPADGCKKQRARLEAELK